MSRRSSLFAVITALLLLVAACGGEGTEPATEGRDVVGETPGIAETPADAGTPADEGTAAEGAVAGEIDVWIMQPGSDDLEQIIEDTAAAFEEENPEAQVNVQFVPWASAHDQFVTAIGGGSVPDVAEMGTTWTPEFAELGALAAQEELSEDYIESLVNSGTVEGQAYGLPWYAGARSLIYRSDVLEEIGADVPDTWDDLIQVGEAIDAETDLYPIGVAGDYRHMLLPMVWQAGGEIAEEVNGTFEPRIDSPEGVEAFSFFADLYERGWAPEGALTWNSIDVRTAFENGDLAMMVGGGWDVPVILENAPDLEDSIGTALLPEGPGGSRDTFAGGSHLVVFEESDNRETAQAFAEFMLQPERVTEFTDAIGFLPGTASGIEASSAMEDPLFETFATQLRDHSRTYPPTPAWGALEGDQVFVNAIQQVMRGELTAEEAVAQVSERMAEEFGEG